MALRHGSRRERAVDLLFLLPILVILAGFLLQKGMQAAGRPSVWSPEL